MTFCAQDGALHHVRVQSHYCELDCPLACSCNQPGKNYRQEYRLIEYQVQAKADHMFDPSMPFSDVEIAPHAYDKEKAKSILENARWVDTDGDGIREKDGVRLAGEIVYRKGGAIVDDIALALSAQLNEIGMAIKVRGMEMTAYFAELRKRGFAIAFSTTYGIAYDPYTSITNMNPDAQMRDEVLVQALLSVKNGGELIRSLNAAVDEEEIRKKYDLILNHIHDQAIFVLISYTKEVAVYNRNKIGGYAFHSYPEYCDVRGIRLK
uniref:Solute-binding protein family 5 domain-containing protein n=1 Tax=Thermosporothrix sp. COM3 TaxID=2490863 RepID=A0A455SFH7_9CHLR|nr:hypothetical protein KTC_19740 [Thermosporothrix sp. COM3]